MYRALQGRCGIFCGGCEIYLAYSTSDRRTLQKIAREQSAAGGAEVGPDQVKCLGCRSSDSDCWRSKCAIRSCAQERGNEFCYQCRDFACDELNRHFDEYPEARENLRLISKIGPDAWVLEMMSRKRNK